METEAECAALLGDASFRPSRVGLDDAAVAGTAAIERQLFNIGARVRKI